MRQFIVISLLIVATSCGPKEEPHSVSIASPSPPAEPQTIGPQFWKYDLKEYSIVTNDVVSGLGGRWISVRYQRRPEQTTTRESVVSHITTALQADGWKTERLPAGKYVLSKIWETSAEDLHFTRRAKADEPAHWFFVQTLFVSNEADTVAVYCEVGW
jgi:hypothetical protein